jgi:HTH-type transcriptional regulator, competence development regulator
MGIYKRREMEFGRLLRKLRQKKGKSIKKVAEDLNLNYTYISKLENSKGLPSAETVSTLSHYFSYNSDELMLSAGKIPADILKILQGNPKEAAEYLRRKFGGSRNT